VISGSKFTVNKILGYNTMAFVVLILMEPEAVKELKNT
jgi:hypothetical protein